jgi:hypothetical protein
VQLCGDVVGDGAGRGLGEHACPGNRRIGAIAEGIHVREAGGEVPGIDRDPAIVAARGQPGRLDDGRCPGERNADEQVAGKVSRSQLGHVRDRVEPANPPARRVADVTFRERLHDRLFPATPERGTRMSGSYVRASVTT